MREDTMAKKLPYYVRELKRAEDENYETPDNFAQVPRIMLAGIDNGPEVMRTAMGLLAIWHEQNTKTVPFNIGPEYDGLAILRAASQNQVYTLDSYYQNEDELAYLLSHYTEGNDLALLVATDNYYDVHAPYTPAWSTEREVPEGSPADLAEKTNTPVILLVKYDSVSFSSLSKIDGILNFRNDQQIAGFILIDVDAHELDEAKDMLEAEFNMPVFGAIPKKIQLDSGPSLYSDIPEIAADNWEKTMSAVVSTIHENLDVMKILKLARRATDLENEFPDSLFKAQKLIGFTNKTVRIAVARDEAFNHYYQENIDLLRELGAEVLYFSPLKDPILPSGTDGIYLGSGNLINHLAEVSKNESMRRQIKRLAGQSVPILAEGSGAVYLAEAFETESSYRWPLVGVLPTTVKHRVGESHLYYAKFTSRRSDLLSKNNTSMNVLLDNQYIFTPNGASYRTLIRGKGHKMEGFSTDTIWASQSRIHFYSNPVAVARFILRCMGEDPNKR